MSALAIVHTESSCGWGGQELRIIAESAGFLERGHDVCIAAPPESRLLPEARKRGIPVYPVEIARKGVRGFTALRRFLSAREVDVVNTHSSTDTWLAAFALKSLTGSARRARLVRTRHISADISRTPASRWLYRSASAHVVTTGEILREQVMRATGLDGANVTSVPTGLDLGRYAPGDRAAARAALGLPADAFIIGIVATLRSWKGHRYLVDAFARMDDPRALLVIVGDGPGAPYLREQLQALHESRVRLAGNQDDVVPWLQSFDVFVLPSYANEGIPQALMQAMACRIPVVTTRVGAIPEIVTEGETGIFVEPRSAEAIHAALLRLRADAALRERIAEAGRAQASARFGIAAMLDRMEGVFRSVISRAPSAR